MCMCICAFLTEMRMCDECIFLKLLSGINYLENYKMCCNIDSLFLFTVGPRYVPLSAGELQFSKPFAS